MTENTRRLKEKWQSERTKNEKMRQMIEDFVRKQTPFRYVLADCWFASVENMTFIKEKKRKDFVFPLKSNRRVALSQIDKQNNRFVSVDSLPPTTTCQRIYLEQLAFPLLLIGAVAPSGDGSADVLYLVTSDLTLDGSAITALCRKRWKIEEDHKLLKRCASFSKSPTRRVRFHAGVKGRKVTTFLQVWLPSSNWNRTEPV